MAHINLLNDTTEEILSSDTYAGFKEKLSTSNCQRCALCQKRTNIVVDRGRPQANIMVIGEGPGENEDLKGQAFIGRAGKMFDEAMTSAGLDTNTHTLIANVVKCRPPDNRRPKKEEADACRPFLEKQILLVRPQIIILLGATALKHLDDTRKNFSMKDQVGRFFTLPRYPGIQFMVFYHPAALLYNSTLKPAMREHAKDLRRYLDEHGLIP